MLCQPACPHQFLRSCLCPFARMLRHVWTGERSSLTLSTISECSLAVTMFLIHPLLSHCGNLLICRQQLALSLVDNNWNEMTAIKIKMKAMCDRPPEKWSVAVVLGGEAQAGTRLRSHCTNLRESSCPSLINKPFRCHKQICSNLSSTHGKTKVGAQEQSAHTVDYPQPPVHSSPLAPLSLFLSHKDEWCSHNHENTKKSTTSVCDCLKLNSVITEYLIHVIIDPITVWTTVPCLTFYNVKHGYIF